MHPAWRWWALGGGALLLVQGTQPPVGGHAEAHLQWRLHPDDGGAAGQALPAVCTVHTTPPRRQVTGYALGHQSSLAALTSRHTYTASACHLGWCMGNAPLQVYGLLGVSQFKALRAVRNSRTWKGKLNDTALAGEHSTRTFLSACGPASPLTTANIHAAQHAIATTQHSVPCTHSIAAAATP